MRDYTNNGFVLHQTGLFARNSLSTTASGKSLKLFFLTRNVFDHLVLGRGDFHYSRTSTNELSSNSGACFSSCSRNIGFDACRANGLHELNGIARGRAASVRGAMHSRAAPSTLCMLRPIERRLVRRPRQRNPRRYRFMAPASCAGAAFLAFNDTLGHDAGDALLKEVATRLCSCLPKVDIAS